MICIVDYGVGNLFSLQSAFSFLGLDSVVSGDPAVLHAATHIVLPGVGAFGDAAEKLRRTGLGEAVKAEAAAGKPLLGICLGMQLLFEESHEYGVHKGLGLISGTVRPLDTALQGKGLKIPHMGWNALDIQRPDSIFTALPQEAYVYFVHSYYAADCEAHTLATSDYAMPVTAVVKRGKIYGMQFHPEKSGATGLALLKAFAALT